MPQSLEAGDLVEALPENEVEGVYSPGDRGTVQSVYVKDNGERRLLIVWAGSGNISSMQEEIWELSVCFVRHQKLELGDLVRALPGNDMASGGVDYYKAGDEGTLQSFDNKGGTEDTVYVAWARTGQTSSIPMDHWMASCELIKKQEGAIKKGAPARIQGLQGAKHLNGSIVTCEQWDAQKGRWTVRLQNGEEKSLKPENLSALRRGESPKIVEELSTGDLVRACDGARLDGFYDGGDEGTVEDTYIGEDGVQRLRIVWAQSGKASSIRKQDAAGTCFFVQKQTLESGDTIQALPGMNLMRDGREYYKAGAQATVIEAGSDAGQDGEKIRVLWESSGAVSDLPKAQWMSFVRIVRKGSGGAGPSVQSPAGGYARSQAPQIIEEFSVGDLVRASDGARDVGFYNGGDEGTVQDTYTGEDGYERLRIVWAQSGKASSIRKKDAVGVLSFVRKQKLEPGDIIQALPGIDVKQDGRQYYKAGEQATVIETRSDDGKDCEGIRVLWESSGTVSDLPKAQWMSFVRIVRKGSGGAVPSLPAGGYARSQAPQQPKPKLPLFKVGQRARVHGLQSAAAASRNGSIVECKEWDEGKGRWLVHVVTDECLAKPIEMSIKPDNLIPLKLAK